LRGVSTAWIQLSISTKIVETAGIPGNRRMANKLTHIQAAEGGIF
jgi:hypothetical protein